MEKIRVNRGIEVEVNDKGESIIIDIDNALFLNNYARLIERVSEIAASIDEGKELDDNQAILLITDKMSEVCKELDKVFGEGSCDKVFGVGVIPLPYVVCQFLDALKPIIKKYTDLREKQILGKYKARKGGR